MINYEVTIANRFDYHKDKEPFVTSDYKIALSYYAMALMSFDDAWSITLRKNDDEDNHFGVILQS